MRNPNWKTEAAGYIRAAIVAIGVGMMVLGVILSFQPS